MQKLLLFAAFCLMAPRLSAQDAYHNSLLTQLQTDFNLPAGQWLLPNTETATFAGATNYGATVTNITVSGLPFTQARHFVIQQGNNVWDAGHLYRNTAAIASGDKCLLVIWLRGVTPDARLTFLAENTTTYNKEAFAVVRPTMEWAQYLVPFKSTAAYAVNTLQMGVQMASQTQTVEVGGMACLNYQNTVTYEQLPVVLHNDHYPGQEPDAPWRAEAAASIEQIRKANLSIAVLDQGGLPFSGAEVHVEMLQHAFKFGTAVISNRFGGGNAQDNVYEEKMLNLDGNGHGFNEVVFENDLKWPAWEQHWYSSWAEIAASVTWLQQHDISIRGHNLAWPGWGYSPPDIQANGDVNYLKTRIYNHLQHILSYPGVGAACEDWDVLNEITQNNDYANALAGTPGYVSGRELYPQIFQQADSLVPNAKLYLNDYVAIENGDNDNGNIALWKSRIDELLAADAPLEGLGFQGHFGAFPTGIPTVKAIYNDFWNTYGFESKVTEYDIDKLVPPATQAEYMRDILTVTFAHPSQKGFLMWGFWDGAHWQSNAPIFRQDWSLKPSGEAFIDQIFHKWWTDTTVVSSTNGGVLVRGFKGKYKITVSCGGVSQEQTVVLDGDKTLDFQLNCVTDVQAILNDLSVKSALNGNTLLLSWDKSHLTKPVSVRVLNAAGQVMAELNGVTGSQQSIEAGNWPAGVYFFSVGNGMQTGSGRIVIAH